MQRYEIICIFAPQLVKMEVNLTIKPDFEAIVRLPVSKSIANRELLINSQCIMQNSQFSILNSQLCDDILMMQRGLTAQDGDTIDVDGAGTALRFLTAYWATRQGCTVTITGNPRLCERPIAPLVDALRQLGADIDYLVQPGYAPLQITGCQLHGGHLILRGDVTSQFVSALLMPLKPPSPSLTAPASIPSSRTERKPKRCWSTTAR